MTAHDIGLDALASISKTDLALLGAIAGLLAAIMHAAYAMSPTNEIAVAIIAKS